LYGILHGFLKPIIRLPNQYDYKLTGSLITTANIEYTRLLIFGWIFSLKADILLVVLTLSSCLVQEKKIIIIQVNSV
jgi:hypothetical protein